MSYDVSFRYNDGRPDRLVASCTTHDGADNARRLLCIDECDADECVISGLYDVCTGAPSYHLVTTL